MQSIDKELREVLLYQCNLLSKTNETYWLKKGENRMLPNNEYIFALIREKQLSNSQLSKIMELSKAEVSRWMSGERKGGKKLFAGIIKAFPNEPLQRLFIFTQCNL